MIHFLIAIQFLTIAPPLVRRAFKPREMGRATGFFPLVGVLLGGILVGVDVLLAGLLPDTVRAVVLLIVWVALTGALHMDGLLDSFDGILGGFTPEARLEILKDERVGAFGLTAGVLHLLLKYSALSSALRQAQGTVPGGPAVFALLLAPVLGRWAMTLAIFAFPYAREKGLGSDIKTHTGWFQVLLASLTAAAAAWFTAQWAGLAILAAIGLFVWGYGAFITRRIPGLTGDSYGALCELTEALTLVGLVIWITI